MEAKKKAQSRWFSKIFEPTVDFYELLNEQAERTVAGGEALVDWLKNGGEERSERVRDLERQADELKIHLERKLVQSFVTPFDREDIFELSAALDEVINNAKAVVREVEAFEVTPDTQLVELAEILLEGTQYIRNSIFNLRRNLKEAGTQALLARKAENRFVKTYRIAMRDLLQLDDFKTVMRIKEVYKQMIVGSERIDRVGEFLLHIIVKLS